VGCTLGSVWGGLRLWEGLSIAVAMNARGAMELVVASLGLSLGILNDRMFSIIVVVAIATSFMAPLGLRFTMRRVRMTDEEARRILAAKSKGVLDPANLRILVASLGGPSDLAAERLAAALAKQSAQRVEILKVRARQPWRTRFRKLLSRERAKPDTTDAAASSEGLPAEDIQGRVVRRSIKRDDAARAVVDEASRGYDLVVLGAAGTGHWVGGHVIEDVVRSAPCHLVILKADPRGRPLLKVLAVYDGGVFSRVAVEIAARNAEASGAGLTVAVVSDRRHSTAQAELDASPAGGMPSATVGAAGEHSDGRTGATDDIAHISPVFNTLELRPEVIHVSSDSFTSRLVNEAHAGVYDLIVLGVENRAVQHRLFFGRDNETLIREASAAVAVVVPNIAQLR
jgi:nucleotide-binding universal stress UspA family protein